MSVAFDKLKPGMVLLDIHSEAMGNTTMRRLGCWKVLVVSVDPVERSAMCRWNGNPAQKHYEAWFRKLHLKPTKAYLAQQERCNNRGGR